MSENDLQQARSRARRTALILGLVAVAVFIGFMALVAWRGS